MAKNETKTKTDGKVSGFRWITADTPRDAFITVDKQLRLYFNTKAIDIIKSRSAMIGYDHANKRIIVGNPEVVRPANVKPHNIDKRGYTSARPFVRALGLSISDLPLRYGYIGKDFSVDGAHAFELMNDEKAGGDGRL